MMEKPAHHPNVPEAKVVPIAHDRSKEFHWKFNRPVATKMIRLQNPLLRFHKTTKGNFSGEDFQISPMVSFLDDSDSLSQIMPIESNMWTFLNSLGKSFMLSMPTKTWILPHPSEGAIHFQQMLSGETSP